MHVGNKNIVYPDLKVHDSLMELVLEDTYLGDVVQADGKNTSNIQNRVSKGLGKISQIMNILETVSFGNCYYQIALNLREAIFLNGILTNADSWYNVTKGEIEQIEMVDRLLLRRILVVRTSTPNEALCLDIETIVKGMRLKFLHSLVNQDKNCMLYKFFIVQWENPVTGATGQE